MHWEGGVHDNSNDDNDYDWDSDDDDADNYDDGNNDDYDDDGDADAADALLWNAVDPRKPLDLRARSLYLYSSDEDNHHQDLLCSVYYCRSTFP